MAWPKGKTRPPNSGIKKGTKHKRTMAEEACKRLGIDPFDLLARAAMSGDVACIIQLCKHIEPPRKPLDVVVDPENNKIEIIVRDYGSKT